MILTEKSTQKSIQPNLLAAVIMLLLVLLLGFFLFRNTGDKKATAVKNEATIFCDAEKVSGDFFVNGDHQFSGAALQTKDYARSGSYACLVEKGKEEQQALEYELKEYKPGDTYRASVWRFRKDGGREAALVATGTGAGQFLKKTINAVREEGDWEQIVLYFTIPKKKKVDQIKIYVSTDGKLKMFFDDLEIKKVDKQRALSDDANLQHLNLRIADKSIRKLEEKRKVAYRAGILESTDDDWVKARLSVNDQEQELKSSVRLKGDWLDHLGNNKWSFRVKMKGGDTWNRLRIFSLQTPKARFFLYEYILHKLWEAEDVLTPRYDFITLDLNGKSRGVYAFEEHFDKVLVEFKKRREGPIIKMSEEGFWSSVKMQMKGLDGGLDMDLGHSVHKMETSNIEPFGGNKTANSASLKKQFEIAQNLLFQYRTGSKSVEEIFDLDRMAKFYAICDVMGAYHGLAWHNQRFYYNPVTSKLEPIGYDGFSTGKSKRSTILGHGALNSRTLNYERLDAKLFMNKQFTALYLKHLRRLSDAEYFDSFLTSIEGDLEAREALIQTEFKKYDFNRTDLVRNVRRVSMLLNPFNDLSAKVYIDKEENGYKHLKIGNTYNLPLEVIGWGGKKEEMTNELSEPILLESFVPRKLLGLIQKNKKSGIILDSIQFKKSNHNYHGQEFLSYQSLKVPESAKYLFIRPLGADTVFYSSMLKWSPPGNNAPAQELFAQVDLSNTDYMTVDEHQIYFRKGQHQINKKLIIPEGYNVHFEAGTTLDFVNQAGFISRSPVFMHGVEEAPVMITSSDKTANGFTILQASERSKLGHVIFDNFNTLNYKGWTLTGAVTFYESDVSITNTVFRNNHCEDGLNLVRSEFTLENSIVSNTAFDGMDCDFCKGTVTQCRFYNTGNDGLDFSGSNITVSNCTIEGSKDKGISVGEDTDASVYNTSISGSPIAVAAKDLSVLVVDNLSIKDCEQGFVAYQKKPEFGGSTIIVKKYDAKNLRRLHNIQKGCVLQLKGQVIRGE